MDIRVVLGILSGCVMGGAFTYFCFRRGLDAQEWIYLQSFREALRSKRYREHWNDEEGGDEHGEQGE